MKQMTLDGKTHDLTVEHYVEEYCEHCSSGRDGHMTKHRVVDGKLNKEGTGGHLICTECGSSRLWKIQGFNACLM